jgi:hypothetical protein
LSQIHMLSSPFLMHPQSAVILLSWLTGFLVVLIPSRQFRG